MVVRVGEADESGIQTEKQTPSVPAKSSPLEITSGRCVDTIN